jgi:hypothetical protein
LSQRAACCEYGIHYKTLKRILTHPEPPGYRRTGPKRPSSRSALERVATLAGTVADSFEKGADLLEEMAGSHLSESTVERTIEDACRRLAVSLHLSHRLSQTARFVCWGEGVIR